MIMEDSLSSMSIPVPRNPPEENPGTVGIWESFAFSMCQTNLSQLFVEDEVCLRTNMAVTGIVMVCPFNPQRYQAAHTDIR